jgi:CDP-glycerol glycerophosphotransferase (TagB/SpsB family)
MDMKTILQKVKQKGVRGTCRAVVRRVFALPNKAFLWWYQRHCPIQQNLILLESDGDLMDNGYALFDYMNRQGYLKKYYVIWMVSDVEKASKHQFPNTEYLPKFPQYFNRRWTKALATCHWCIFDHANVLANINKRKEQKIVYLSHGVGYKTTKANELKQSDLKSRDDFITVPGELGRICLSNFTGEPIEKTIVTGYPRNDYFFQENKNVQKRIQQCWRFQQYSKVILWMPTFKQSDVDILSEDYIHNETGLSLFNHMKDLESFSAFLKEKNILLVLKLHPYQAELPVFQRHYDNILVLRNKDLETENLQLYQVIPYSDALITDYSSIATDYLLLDKPIIFTLDDYEEYAASRGAFFPENAKDYMKGYHIYNVDDLEKALRDIAVGKDIYKEEREKIFPEYHAYKDGNSARRVLDAIGVK